LLVGVVRLPEWLEAGLWGLLAGGALVLGAGVAWFLAVPRLVVAGCMAFGAGALVSALAFELVDEAEQTGGLAATVTGFLGGAISYVIANTLLARRGARHRKRSAGIPPFEAQLPGSSLAIAVGALLDGLPESAVLGMSLLGGQGVGVAVLAAILVSNIPEGLASAAGMKRIGHRARYVFGVWGAIAVASGAAAVIGNLALRGASPATVAFITAIAAGGILTMVADTMIPEAFEQTHLFTGLITTAGFLTAFTIGRIG
jgi:zinc transporter, ZIP family